MDQATATLPSESTLVDLRGIGPAVFGANPPSERTIRSLTKRGILPVFRIGRLIRYDPRLVRAALDAHCLVQSKKAKAKPAEASRS